MHTLIQGTTRIVCRLAVVGAIILAWQAAASAASGTWTESTGDGLWSSGANWSGGTVADGSGNTADFSTVDLNAVAVNGAFPGFYRNAIQLDSARTIGNMTFGDSNTGTPGGWEIYTNDIANNLLTLAGASPTITVNPLGPIDTATLGAAVPEVIDDAIIRPTLVGTSGFTKMGTGVLSIAGTNPNLTGNINVNQGTLRLRTGSTFDFETGTVGPPPTGTVAVTRFVIANGATLETQISVGQNAALPAAAGVSVPAGATATLRNTATINQGFANVTGGAGSTLNFVSTNTGAILSTVDRDWSGFTTVNFTGSSATPSQFRLRNNGGTFNANSFLNTNVNLTNALVFTNTNSGGNTNFIGALSGDAASTLQGGAAGSVAIYQIGNLNSDTTFAGAVTTGTGFALFKVGSGKLTLSGNLTYTTTNNATADRRGGITRISAGTLALTGAAAIPGGIVDGTLGNLFTSIDVKTGATFDVSGTTGEYSTASLQQLMGIGTVKGNYLHDEGTLKPGDVPVTNTNNTVATAGTLTFQNNLDISGGEINFDISPSLATGNDKLVVGGGALSGNAVINVGFLGGATTGPYTMIQSTTALTGSIASWTVNWQGRGAAPTLTQNPNSVVLNVTAGNAGTVAWRGNVSGTWDAGSAGTQNWQNVTLGNPGSADKFFQLDTAKFLDTYDGTNAPTTTTVTLNSVVSPSSVVVNSSLAYTISGTGRITGGGSLTKQGSGKLTTTQANDYSGGTTISGGILDLGGTGMAGTGTITLSGGALHAGAAANFTMNNAFVISGSNVISNNNTGAQTLILNGSISGSGTLSLENNNPGVSPATPVRNGIDLFGDNTGFHGSIVLGGPTPVALRFRTVASAGTDIAYDLGNNFDATNSTFVQLSTVVGANSTMPMGSLKGGPNAHLSGHNSGAGAGTTVYQIGSLGTSTLFEGVIENGNTATSPDNFTALTKVGGGTLTLTGVSTYTGDTRVQAGTLSITNAYLADASDVYVSNGAFFNLNFVGTDTIDSLFFGNTPKAVGTWGAPGSGATFTDARLTGTGLLSVTTLGVAPSLIGDYNSNGVVDAADYTVWRDHLGQSFALANRDAANTGNISSADYDSWKAHFGQTGGAGSNLSGGSVPEPASALLLIVAAWAVSGLHRPTRRS